jgi:hypothetical protein
MKTQTQIHGVLAKYAVHVTSASEGAVTDIRIFKPAMGTLRTTRAHG